jgi:hypothetical protein
MSCTATFALHSVHPSCTTLSVFGVRHLHCRSTLPQLHTYRTLWFVLIGKFIKRYLPVLVYHNQKLTAIHTLIHSRVWVINLTCHAQVRAIVHNTSVHKGRVIAVALGRFALEPRLYTERTHSICNRGYTVVCVKGARPT